MIKRDNRYEENIGKIGCYLAVIMLYSFRSIPVFHF